MRMEEEGALGIIEVRKRERGLSRTFPLYFLVLDPIFFSFHCIAFPWSKLGTGMGCQICFQ